MFYGVEKDYISPTQYDLWHTNRKAFEKLYFKKEKFSSESMERGKLVHEIIENGLYAPELSFGNNEFKLEIRVDGLPVKLYGILDDVDFHNGVFVDYKTGSKANAKKLIHSMKQELYAYMILAHRVELDKVTGYIEHIALDGDDIKGTTVLGSFEYGREEMPATEQRLITMYEQVNDAYANFDDSEQEVSDDLYKLSEELYKVIQKKKELEDEEKFIKTAILEHMKEEKVDKVEAGFGSVFIKKMKKIETPKELDDKLAKIKADIKKAKMDLEAKGQYDIIESVSYRF